MKNGIRFFGLVAAVAIIGLGFAGCPNDAGNGDEEITATFSLDKVDERTYTITVEGSTWKEAVSSGGFYEESSLNVITNNGFPSTISATTISPQRTGDTVLTHSIPLEHFSSVSGTITLTESGLIPMVKSTNHPNAKGKINPAKKSITF